MRIMVVDDEQLVLEDFLRELKSVTEAEVSGFTDSSLALQAAHDAPPRCGVSGCSHGAAGRAGACQPA